MVRFGLVGATNYIGQSAAGILREAGHEVVGFSREPKSELRKLLRKPDGEPDIPYWIDVGQIDTFPQRFDAIRSYNPRKIVALSSTSRFTKVTSGDAKELDLVKRLEKGEASFSSICESNGVQWVLLRPTLIYGLGKDKNVREIAGMIRRFGFFPIFGEGSGKRQPVHAEDLASACVKALLTDTVGNRAYNISGGEVLTYREMVRRIFEGLGRKPMMPTIPLGAFSMALAGLRLIPRFRHWTPQMAERMNKDMVFDHSEAAADFGFSPRPFVLHSSELR